MKSILFIALLAMPCAYATEQVKDKRLDEISGIDASHAYDGMYYVHNDSGGKPRVFMIDEQGETFRVVKMDAKFDDWEDIAVDHNGVHVADFGDNSRSRDHYDIYSFKESKGVNVRPTRLRYRYGNGKSYNAEALVSYRGSLYVIVKGGNHRVFRLPKEDGKAREVCRLKIDDGIVTAADVNDDSTEMLVRTKKHIRVYDVRRSICGKVTDKITHREKQGEAIAYRHHIGFITISEGKKAPIYIFD